jgi:Rab-like protein 5
MPEALKVAIIGPKEGGKTRFTNHVTAQGIPPTTLYDPTVGVRVVQHVQELEVPQPVPTEVWDCSGDHEYESCWPALLQDLNGIIVVFNPANQTQVRSPDSPTHAFPFCICVPLFTHFLSFSPSFFLPLPQTSDARVWCEWFCLKAQLGKGQCVMLALTEDSSLQHAPLVIMNGDFNVPIVNVSATPVAAAPGADPASAPPTTAQRAFGKIINSMNRRRAAKLQQQQQQQQE